MTTARPLIGYARVSTSRQGRSRLGLEPQREAIERIAQAEGFELGRVFVEVETGKGADAIERRPQLAAALADGRKHKCPVVVAKLDRLSRDVHFISGLMAADLAVGILGEEREDAGLAATSLGTNNGIRPPGARRNRARNGSRD